MALAADNPADAPVCSIDRRPLRPVPPSFFGVSAKEIHFDTPDHDLVAERIASSGAYYVGTKVHWEVLEQERGDWQWQKYDPQLDAYTHSGLQPLVTLRGTPAWASSAPSAAAPEIYPAANLDDWRAFIDAAVSRWGPEGTGQVRDWEIWNEPNAADRFQGSPDDYLVLLEAAYEVIHRRDPEARVWAPAITYHPWSGDTDLWLRQIVDRGRFDVLSIHLYFNRIEYMLSVIRRVQQTLELAGRGDHPLAISEINVVDSITRCRQLGELPEAVHAQIVSDLLTCVGNAGVDHLLYFKATDLNMYCRPPDDDLVNRIGLFDEQLQPKARWLRFRDLAHRQSTAEDGSDRQTTADQIPLFADGFESGDTSAWKKTQPGPGGR